MKNLQKILLCLAFIFPFANAQNIENITQHIATKQINQINHKWFRKGDLYELHNKKVPIKIIICKDNLFPPYLKEYELIISRDDNILEVKRFKDGKEFWPPYKVDKTYFERFTDEYLKGWIEQTNYWLKYLSGNQFQLELEEIERIDIDYWNDENYLDNIKPGRGFTMIVHPNAVSTGYYSGNGIFWVNPIYLFYDKNNINKYSITPIHEILHSFFGENHSNDSLSTIYHSPNFIYLSPDEAEFLGWPKVEPKKLEKIKF
ncbi:MAG: hypothetical protein QXO12_02410 [Candidatus Pacearchaeota archaeon]